MSFTFAAFNPTKEEYNKLSAEETTTFSNTNAHYIIETLCYKERNEDKSITGYYDPEEVLNKLWDRMNHIEKHHIFQLARLCTRAICKKSPLYVS